MSAEPNHLPTREDLRMSSMSKSDGLQILAVLSNLIHASIEEKSADDKRAKQALIEHVQQIQRRLMDR